MKNYSFNIALVFFLACFFFLLPAGIFFDLSFLRAGSADNVFGFAWSENIGWVSFNSLNCDTDANGQSNGGAGCPAAGTAVPNYGVNIDQASGIFSGYAWSEHVGWLSFKRSDTGAPPAPPYNGGGISYIARVDLNTKEVSGWARVLANGGGWDGWIKLRCSGSECNTSNYGLSIDDSVNPREFRGWAWSDMVSGWLSFNRANCDANKDGFSDGSPAGCPVAGTVVSDYKVTTSFYFNAPPAITPSNPVQGNYCGAPFPPVYLSWNYNDPENDPQAIYQVQIDNNSDFSSPEIDTGQVNSSSNTYAPMNLPYDDIYYWRVMAWDDQGSVSNWANGNSFETEMHAYPSVDFTFQPPAPRVNKNTAFIDQSTVYGGSSKEFFSWTFQSGDPSISSQQNPVIQFNSQGIKNVSFQVTDSDGFSCSKLESITVQQVFPSPEWQEIPPISWIKNVVEGLMAFLRRNLELVSLR